MGDQDRDLIVNHWFYAPIKWNFAEGLPHLDWDLFGPLPFFLSFTQAWLFIPFDGTALYERYSELTPHAQATGVMWSLSTEWFFYAAYPFFSVWLSRRTGRALAVFAIAASVAAVLFYGWITLYRPSIQAFGIALFGTPRLGQDFATWLWFYSPIGRITEFLLGAAAAQYFLSSSTRGRILAYRPSLIGPVLVLAILGWTASIFTTGSSVSVIAVLIACLVLFSVTRRTWISQVLGSRGMVIFGEASYSLYLLHYYTMHEVALHFAWNRSAPVRLAIFFIGVAFSLTVSRAVYVMFERPAQRWLRANFKPLRLHITLVTVFLVTTFFCILASKQIHAAGHLIFEP